MRGEQKKKVANNFILVGKITCFVIGEASKDFEIKKYPIQHFMNYSKLLSFILPFR